MKLQRGFSMIELMVVAALAGILMAVGIPALRDYSENSKLRTAASSLNAALQNARQEAVQRNQIVQLVLTTSDPIAANVGTTSTNRTGPNWIIRTQAGGTSTFDFLAGSSITSGTAGSASAVGMVASLGGASVSIIQFDPLSRASFPEETPATTASAMIEITNPTGGVCAPIGPMRCLNVLILRGGGTKVCDPIAKDTDATDTRRCS